MIQTIIALIMGVAALIYVGNKLIIQFRKSETDPKCENCSLNKMSKDRIKG